MNQYIDISNLSPEDLEAYNRDPEAFMGWLDTVMLGGTAVHLDSLLMEIIERKPYNQPSNWEYHPLKDTKWTKRRSGNHNGGGYYAQQEAREQKRLDKRAITKANRKRARNSR